MAFKVGLWTMKDRVATETKNRNNAINMYTCQENIPDPPPSMNASPWPDNFCLKNACNTNMILEK